MSRGFLDDDTSGRSNLCDIKVTIVHQTKDAWLVRTPAGEAWVPKSVGELDDGVMTLPEAMAEEKGLI